VVKQDSLEVAFGSHVNVTCGATGHPVPTVSLLYQYDERNVTVVEGQSMISYKVAVLDTFRMYCLARNRLVSPAPCGKMTYSEDSSEVLITPLL